MEAGVEFMNFEQQTPSDLRSVINERRRGTGNKGFYKRQKPYNLNSTNNSKIIRVSAPTANENESITHRARRLGGMPCPICQPHGYLIYNEVEHFCFNCYGTAFRPKNKPYSNFMQNYVHPRGYVKSFRSQQQQPLDIVIPPMSPPRPGSPKGNRPFNVGPPQRIQKASWNVANPVTQPYWNIGNPPTSFDMQGYSQQMKQNMVQGQGVMMFRRFNN